MVPTFDQYRSYASKAQQQLVNQFLSSPFSGRSWDRIGFDDEDETSVKSHSHIMEPVLVTHSKIHTSLMHTDPTA